MRCLVALLLVLAALTTATPAIAEIEEPGRWVDFGKWNGIADCESSPSRLPALAEPGTREHRHEVRVDQTGRAGERSWAQFLRSTWRRVAELRDKHHLIKKDPGKVTLAQTMRQSLWLKWNVGISQWTCGHRFDDGTGPVYVTGEHRLPRDPERCARNLHRKWGRSWRVARSVCGVGA